MFIAVYNLNLHVSITPLKLQCCFTLYISSPSVLFPVVYFPSNVIRIHSPTSQKSSPNSPKYSLSCLTYIFGLASQPVAEVLAYLHVQVSPISC